MKPAAAGTRRVRIRVLGPFAVWVDRQPVALTAGRLRTVLATLAFFAGEPVSLARLSSAVWGDDPPKDARRAVQLYVTRLRRLLGPDLIGTMPEAYVVATDAADVDAARFTRLLSTAKLAADAETERLLLAEALELWRGDPFEGVPSTWLDTVAATQLADRRLVALERRIELDLALDRPGDLVAELRELTTLHPLRERLWGLFMTALSRNGQRADALAAYRRLYRLLAVELGIEPSADVREVHRQILSGDVPIGPSAGQRVGPPTPRQLPAGTGYFTGRSAGLAQLDALLSRDGRLPTAVVVSAIGGAAGVGKTALAVHWARRVAGHFPDGQLYANLRGFDPSAPPVRPHEVICGFLEALGLSPRRIPMDPEAQVGLYRTLLAGKRVLVLLDNVRDADHVRPLIPGTAGCLVVVTSRSQLSGLVAHDGARMLHVDVLDPDEGLQLLMLRLGHERVAAERAAAEEIVERCSRLPLALNVVAARAVAHPAFPLAALAAELRDARDRLDTLSDADPQADVRTVFAVSYRTLSQDAARVFRLLGLHPGPDTSAAAAASLAGMPLARIRASLSELSGVHLIVEETPGRYTFHDLLRTYAAELTAAEESCDEQRAVVRRILDHYLHSAHAAAHHLSPHRDHPVSLSDPAVGVVPERLGDDGPALLAWFAAEHAVLLAGVRLAVDVGLDAHALRLAWTLGGYLARSGRWAEWVATQRVALGAAERLADGPEQARAHRGLARAYRQLGQADDALAHLHRARRLCAELGEDAGLGHTHMLLTQVYEMRGELPAAHHHAKQALRLFRSVHDPLGEAFALNVVGWCHGQLGHHQEALSHCTRALRLQQKLGDRYGEATTWDSLGFAHHHLGDHDQAIACYEASLALRRAGGERYGEARTLIRLGDTQAALGAAQAAAEAWRRAVAMLEALDHPDADWAVKRLDTARRGPGPANRLPRQQTSSPPSPTTSRHDHSPAGR